MKKIRIIDVADQAHVSKSTVSQYLNGRFEYMSEETKERVKKAIEDLNYVPNNLARSLKTDKTKTIAVIVRDVTGNFTSRVVRAIDDFCKENKYNVLIYNTDFDKEIEKQSLKLLKGMRVDGIIIMSSGKNNLLIEREQQSGFPIVQVQMEYDDVETSVVLSDYKEASLAATEYLIGLGHRRICFLTQEYETIRSRLDRFIGYKKALEKHNIPLDMELVVKWNKHEGFKTKLSDILKWPNPPTAFFCQHFTITRALLEKVEECNISIPEDISLISFDEIPMVEQFKVPISVIAQSPYTIGNESAKQLLEKINTGSKEIIKTIIPCQFIERASCRKID